MSGLKTASSNNLRIALAQINCTVGDLEGNSRKIIRYVRQAKGLKADLIAFPELAICGYPPEDLLLKPKFVSDNIAALRRVAKSIDGGITAVVGFVDKHKDSIYNAAAVIRRQRIIGIYHKSHLPNYGVFDEKRYFAQGAEASVFSIGGFVFGVNICEDIWHKDGPIREQAKAGARLIININASPYHMGKIKERQAVLAGQARSNRVFIAYINLVGGQDELVFDGQSMVVAPSGNVIAKAPAFREDLLIIDTGHAKKALSKPLDLVVEVYQALLLGLSDYITKNGFKKVVIGLSGGIDSALVLALATDALGKENVTAVFMPSMFSSKESQEDAEAVAQNLGVKFINISINRIFELYLNFLKPHFGGRKPNTAEENLQARIRGNILMALSNKFGWLVLATGNKSEMSAGYATLYGDMAGGFAVIKDVPKTLVYKLADYRNSLGEVIPERVLTKEPTAELKPNQKDCDTLPPYAVLDPILKAYIEGDKESDKIVSLGFSRDVVSKVLSMVDKSEYKRRQSPPGIKITPRAFGRDRRMPITNRYRG